MKFAGRFVGALLVFSGTAYAHPVSYQDGVGIMSYNTSNTTEILLTYSLSPKFAVAHTYLRDSKSEFFIPRFNSLAKRWNNSESQANIYMSLGSGIEKFGTESAPAHLGELVIDWESRKYYTYLEHLYINRSSSMNSQALSPNYNHTKLRLGFAPFLADYEDLNIWFVTQFDRHGDAKQIDATQFLRFYRKNVLWEIGAGFDGSLAFNFMIHL